jgi:hypothetical protein
MKKGKKGEKLTWISAGIRLVKNKEGLKMPVLDSSFTHFTISFI